MGRRSAVETEFFYRQWCPATVGPYYLMLNGRSRCGMEILALAALFGLQRQLQQRPRLFFGVSESKTALPETSRSAPASTTDAMVS